MDMSRERPATLAEFVKRHAGEPYATSNGRIVNVAKELEVGPRGGVRYLNSRNRWVYLKEQQVKQCLRDRQLPGDMAQVCKELRSRSRRSASDRHTRRYGGLYRDTE